MEYETGTRLNALEAMVYKLQVKVFPEETKKAQEETDKKE